MDGRTATAQGKAFPGDPGAAAGRPSQPITEVELEAVYTQRSRIIPWQALTDSSCWRQGWH
jgi:hypothetical protein